MLHVVESTKPLTQLAADLEQAVTRHKFGVLGVHDLKAKMAEKSVPFARECRIFEVCNPHQAKKVLEANRTLNERSGRGRSGETGGGPDRVSKHHGLTRAEDGAGTIRPAIG